MKRRQTSHQLPFAGGFRLKSEKQQLIALGDLKEGSEKQWFTDFEDFGPIPRPTSPDDWLAQYTEPGQTFREFLTWNPWLGKRKCSNYKGGDFNPVSGSIRERYPSGKMYLAQIGDFGSNAAVAPDFDLLAKFAEEYLCVPIAKFAKIEVIEEGSSVFLEGETLRRVKVKNRRKGGRMQLNSPSVLAILSQNVQTPEDSLGVIALTMHDMYEAPPDLFVAGLAGGSKGVAVFSFARYDPRVEFSTEFWYEMRDSPKRFKGNEEARRRLVLARSCKLLVHEIGHLLGMAHCVHFACCMNGSGHLAEDFAQPMFLCPICLRKLHHLCGFDIEERYMKLSEFFTENGMSLEEKWVRRRLERQKQ